MDDFDHKTPELGYGLDPDAADMVGDTDEPRDDLVCGPGDGDAVIMSWARAM